ncbi:THUMP-like domain-containing protein [Dysgonomonas reticulitermitis]
MISATLNGFVKEHENDDIRVLALHATQYPEIDMQLAIRQIKGRQIAKEKIPGWYINEKILYPKHLSLEQSSSEKTARYKATLVAGDNMVDLTGGMGVDFSFLATKFKHAVYVEQQTELTEIAAHNFKELGLTNVTVKNTEALSYLQEMPPADLIYIDPARRDAIGRKTVSIEDCTPNILELESLLSEKGKLAMIKLSPMLDISLALKSLSGISDVHIVSHNNECKELLFIKRKVNSETRYHCVNIQKEKTDILSFTRVQEEETAIVYKSQTGKYLYEPNASITKAGAYKYLSTYYKIDKIHPNSHLYTSDSYIPDFHGRSFIIENVCSLNKKEVKQYLHNIKQANITTRNFPLSVQELRKRTGLKDGGDIFIFATTLADEKKVLLICKKAN